jgi:hypothetical protein
MSSSGQVRPELGLTGQLLVPAYRPDRDGDPVGAGHGLVGQVDVELVFGERPLPRQNLYMACEMRFRGSRSGCAVVLVDHAAEQSSSPDSGVKVDHHGRIVLGRALVAALVRSWMSSRRSHRMRRRFMPRYKAIVRSTTHR